MNKIKLIAILGTDRSGSTLLDKILGGNPGVFSTGELHRFYEYYDGNFPCTCGFPFLECNIWRAVARRFDNKDMSSLRLMTPLGWKRRIGINIEESVLPGQYSTRGYQRYAEICRAVCSEIMECTGCGYIVDSSKDATRAYILHMSGLFEVFPIHITRPVEDYLVSLKRTQFGRRGNRHIGRVEGILKWTFRNFETALLLQRIRKNPCRLSYENLAKNHSRVIRAISDRYDLPLQYEEETIRDRTYHLLGGNISKFNRFDGVYYDRRSVHLMDRSSVAAILNRLFIRDNLRDDL